MQLKIREQKTYQSADGKKILEWIEVGEFESPVELKGEDVFAKIQKFYIGVIQLPIADPGISVLADLIMTVSKDPKVHEVANKIKFYPKQEEIRFVIPAETLTEAFSKFDETAKVKIEEIKKNFESQQKQQEVAKTKVIKNEEEGLPSSTAGIKE